MLSKHPWPVGLESSDKSWCTFLKTIDVGRREFVNDAIAPQPIDERWRRPLQR